MMVEKEPLYPGKTVCGPITVGHALEKYFDSLSFSIKFSLKALASLS